MHKPPLVKTTVAKATRRKVLLAPLASGICLRKPQKLSSVQPSVACLLVDEGICLNSKEETK